MDLAKVEVLVDEWVNEITKVGINGTQYLFETKGSEDDEVQED